MECLKVNYFAQKNLQNRLEPRTDWSEGVDCCRTTGTNRLPPQQWIKKFGRSCDVALRAARGDGNTVASGKVPNFPIPEPDFGFDSGVVCSVRKISGFWRNSAFLFLSGVTPRVRPGNHLISISVYQLCGPICRESRCGRSPD